MAGLGGHVQQEFPIIAVETLAIFNRLNSRNWPLYGSFQSRKADLSPLKTNKTRHKLISVNL